MEVVVGAVWDFMLDSGCCVGSRLDWKNLE